MPMKPISIYIVEDELLISASLKSQLQQFGYEISGSSIRGEACLEEIAELSRQGREPEIVLMDIHLRGEIDGIETAKRINEQFNCAIIFLTGQSSKEIYERSFRIKPFGYLLKPIDMEQTKMTIEIASYQRNLEIENTLYQKDLEALLEKRSQENRELVAMYQAIVDNARMGLAIMQERKFVFVNPAAADLFGLSQETFYTLELESLFSLLQPDDLQKVTSLSEGFLRNGTLPEKMRLRTVTADQGMRQVEVIPSHILYREKPAVHLTFLDVTPNGR